MNERKRRSRWPFVHTFWSGTVPLLHARQRFSLAHELGHYLCGHESINHNQVVIEPEKRYQDPGYLMEQEADEFAAELLMPTRLLRKDFVDSSLNITRLAKKYDVSEQAMWIQVVNLELVVETNVC